MLDFSKIERGQKTYHMETASLADVLGNVSRTMRFPLAEQGFDFHTEVSGDVPPVRVDRDAIEQAVLNLISNAMKYSGESRTIDVRLSSENGNARIEVRDRGIGIPPQEVKRIFEKFYRVQTPDNRAISGTGLGLALVARIVEAHRGKVEVESAVGKGMPAALMVASLQAAVKTCAAEGMCPKDLCEAVNRFMCGNMGEGFITFFYAVIESDAKRLTYCNAGHNPPFLAVAPSEGFRRLSTGGGILGVFADWSYVEEQVPLASGDRILMYTDGITESRNAADEEFDEDRLIDLTLRSSQHAAALTFTLAMLLVLGAAAAITAQTQTAPSRLAEADTAKRTKGPAAAIPIYESVCHDFPSDRPSCTKALLETVKAYGYLEDADKVRESCQRLNAQSGGQSETTPEIRTRCAPPTRTLVKTGNSD